MHFEHNAFSRSRNKSTVVPRNRTIPETILGSSATATDLDFLHLNIVYSGGTEANFIHCCAFRDIAIYLHAFNSFNELMNWHSYFVI